MRDCCIALAEIQTSEQSGKFEDAKTSLANLAEAFEIQQKRIKDNEKDKNFFRKEHWLLARIEYLRACAYLIQLEPRLAKSSLIAADKALKANLELMETYAETEKHNEKYLKDKNDRLVLKNKIEQAMSEVK